MMKAADTITSTERCRPLFLKYDLTDNQVFIFLTLLRRKCGNSDFLARRADVKCANNFAYRNRCLNVLSATANKKKKALANTQRCILAIKITVRSLKNLRLNFEREGDYFSCKYHQAVPKAPSITISRISGN